MKYILLAFLLIGSAKAQSTSETENMPASVCTVYRGDLLNINSDTTLSWRNQFTIKADPHYWISFDKIFPHISDIDWSDAWVTGHAPDGNAMWKYHFASDTLYVDTTKIKKIIYLK